MFIRIGARVAAVTAVTALVLLLSSGGAATEPGGGAFPSCGLCAEQWQHRPPVELQLVGSPELRKFRLLTAPLGGR